MRWVAAVAVLAAVLAVSPPVAEAAPVVSVVVVPGPGAQETSFATVPGEPYLITVTGTFEAVLPYLDLRTGDCGWWFLRWFLPSPVERSDVVTVDGHPAGCRTMPYSEAHTYHWTETGTGAPFRFAIDGGVNSGQLEFTVTGARAYVPHSVSSSCVARPVATPLLDYVPVVVDASAAASEPASAVSTYIVCDVTTASGESAHIQLGLPGPAVTSVERMTVPPGDRLTVCWSAGATWDDGVSVTTTPLCEQTVVS